MELEVINFSENIGTEATHDLSQSQEILASNSLNIHDKLKKLEIHDLPEEETVTETIGESDKNGTSIFDADEIVAQNKALSNKVIYFERCVENLNTRNNEAVSHINNVEKKLEDLINAIKNKKEQKKKKHENSASSTNEPVELVGSPEPFVADEDEYPALKSYSLKVNKPKGKVIQDRF